MGTTNSWMGQTVLAEPNVCDPAEQPENTAFSSCALWLVVGLVLGSLKFEKKHDTPKS